MAAMKLSFDEILQAARRLPKTQRDRLVEALAGRPTPEKVRAAARSLRGTYRMDPNRRRRMSSLLHKGNQGKLTADEKTELDHLVGEFQTRTLEMAEALVETCDPASRTSANGSAGCP